MATPLPVLADELLTLDASDPVRDQPTPWPDATAGWVRAAQAADAGAFAELHRAYGPLVHGILLSRVDPAEVDDLVQDVFLSAIDRLDTLRDPAAFGAWVAQIARRRAAQHHRARARSRVTALYGEPAGHAPPTVEAEAALRAIQSLPEAYAEPLMLRLVEGMSAVEIAGRTGLSPKYVRVNLHRGMKLLREKLRGSEPR